MTKKFINFEEEDSISKYFKEVRKSVLITQEKEVELAKRIIDGDDTAVSELVTANLKFVITVAKEFQGQGLSFNDLINEGNYGLVKAAHKFDHTKGFRFISYAVWWIKQSIVQSLNDNARMVRLPSNIIQKLNFLKKEIEKFESINERQPMYGEILNGNDEVMELVMYPRCASLNDVINEDGDELIELIASNTDDDNKIIVDDKIKVELNKVLDYLDDREKDIIECYFGINTHCEPMTLEGIGEKYSLTKERIRQIKEKTIKKLRGMSSNLYSVIND